MVLKHNNPCGAAWTADGLGTALSRAFFADRIAAFGGTIVVNRTLDARCAEFIAGRYFEVVAAPDFEERALEILSAKKNLRIIHIPAQKYKINIAFEGGEAESLAINGPI